MDRPRIAFVCKACRQPATSSNPMPSFCEPCIDRAAAQYGASSTAQRARRQRKQRRISPHSKPPKPPPPVPLGKRGRYLLDRHWPELQSGYTKRSPYQIRNDVLLSLNFPSYPDYLRSALWFRIRSRILGRDLHKCRICSEPASCVHHLSYNENTLSGHQNHSLISVCETCHSTIEFEPSGRKRPFFSAQRQAIKMFYDRHPRLLCPGGS